MARGFASLGDLPARDVTTFRRPLGVLAVITHDASAVGYSCEDSGWYCVCDCRIDNLTELSRELVDAGEALHPQTTSAGLLLAAYRAFGERAWSMVDGDFACVIWHPESLRVVLVRDVIGARPLYYASVGSAIAMSSELRCAAALRGHELTLDESQVVRHLSPVSYGATELDRTLFDGIRRVAPGTSVSVAGTRTTVSRYWDPRDLARISVRSLHEAADELHDRVLKATLARADTPDGLGCHLSGGLDCSSIAAMVHTHRVDRCSQLRLFSWTPRVAVAESATELARIDALSRRYGFSIEYLDPDLYWTRDREPEPVLSSPLYPAETMSVEQHVQRRARDLGIRRMLSGWGGDEAASHHGFGIGPELLLTGRWIRLIRYLALHENRWSRSKLRQRGSRLIASLAESLRVRFSSLEPHCLATSAVRGRHPVPRVTDPQYAVTVRRAQMSAYFSGHLTERMESWYCHGKRMGINYAYPLLDRRVLEFAYSLPGWCFADENGSRRVFRSAVARYWPDELADRTPKNETGLAAFLMRGRTFAQTVRDSNVGTKALKAAGPGNPLAQVIDPERIARAVHAAAEDPKGIDLALLSRADQLARIVDWFARSALETDVASSSSLR